jgi:hypothetical protein
MPALENPRHEHYAQLIVEGLANRDSKPYSQSRAYIAAGYTARDGDRNHRSAQASSSRLLSRVIQRVRELQQIGAQNAVETVEKMARELNQIQYEARADKAHAAAVSAVLGKARLLNMMPDEAPKPIDFAIKPTQCKTLDANCCRASGLLRLTSCRLRRRLKRTTPLLRGWRKFVTKRRGLR